MAITVVWSSKAEHGFSEIINYLQLNWGEKEIKNFIKNTNSIIKKIQIFPLAFPLSKKTKNLHRCVLSKQTSMVYLYKVRKKEIEIVSFYDIRSGQNK